MSTQPQQPQFHSQLDKSVHPSVQLAIRNLEQLIYDLQGGVKTLRNQILGGAVAVASVISGSIASVSVQSGGYYLTAPTVTFTGGGFAVKPQAHAVLTGNRVTSVVVDNPGTGGSSVPAVVFTV